MNPIAATLAPVPPKADDAHVAAKQLEAFFLRQFLSEARPEGGGALDGGFAGDTFKQMFDEQIADQMAKAGGMGLADVFAKQLEKAAHGGAPQFQAQHAVAPIETPVARPMPIAALPEGPGLDGAPHFVMPVVGRPSSGYGA
ncbi:MAG TPA: rod-binding protein, partial [Kofleriaceae bacterium]|nr:rod-binding protein [Kofleriaceae bacterium]